MRLLSGAGTGLPLARAKAAGPSAAGRSRGSSPDSGESSALQPLAGAVIPAQYNPLMPSVALSITLNGEPRSLSPESSVRDLVQELGLDEDAVAVERNLAIVSRSSWAETVLRAGDRVEVVRFVGGG